MINVPLLRWTMRRYIAFYLGITVVMLVGFVFIIIAHSHGSFIRIEENPFFSIGLFMALFWGLSIYNREYRNGNLLQFIMARPVSREDFFNTMLLAWVLPLILLMFMPFIYVLALYPWFTFSLPLGILLYVCILAAAWVVVVFLAGINVGFLFLAQGTSRFYRYLSVFAIAALAAVFINLNNLARNGPANTVWQALHHPWLSGMLALSMVAVLYLAGLRKIKRMDI